MYRTTIYKPSILNIKLSNIPISGQAVSNRTQFAVRTSRLNNSNGLFLEIAILNVLQVDQHLNLIFFPVQVKI
jgi:hypothetical protein